VATPAWRDAARLLLNAVGCLEDIAAAKTLPELAKALRGSGFRLECVPVINQVIPEVEGAVGALLERDGHGWCALLGFNERAVLLGAAAQEAAPVDAAALVGVTHAWVLSQSLLDMRSVLPFLQRYRHYFADLFIAAIVVNLFALVLPIFSSFVYDKVLGNGIMETLWALVIGLLLLIGVEFSVRMVRVHIAERFRWAVRLKLTIPSSTT